MTDVKAKESHELAKIVLDYIRVFIWPLILVGGAFLFNEDIVKLINEREIKFAGLEIGSKITERINSVKENTKAEFEDIKKLFEELNVAKTKSPDIAPQIFDKISVKITALDKNIDKDVGRISQDFLVLYENPVKESSLINQQQDAMAFESKGFQFLLNKDIEEAINAFAKAEELWPSYHNVWEIKQFLLSEKTRLLNRENTNNDLAWERVYVTLLSKYSWGMPDNFREKFRGLVHEVKH